MLSINDVPLKSLVETEQMLKRLPKGPVKIVAMPPPTEDDWSQYILSPLEDAMSDEGIITVEVSCLSVNYHIWNFFKFHENLELNILEYYQLLM